MWICPACGKVDDGSPMIGCDGCDAWYHWYVHCVQFIDILIYKSISGYAWELPLHRKTMKTGFVVFV